MNKIDTKALNIAGIVMLSAIASYAISSFMDIVKEAPTFLNLLFGALSIIWLFFLMFAISVHPNYAFAYTTPPFGYYIYSSTEEQDLNPYRI